MTSVREAPVQRLGEDHIGSKGSGRLVLALLCTAQFVTVLDFSIVNVALPSMQQALAIAEGDVQWVLGAYALGFGGCLLLAGRAADVYGLRKLFVAGLALFSIASMMGGVAGSFEVLIAARGLQGLGSALLAPAALALITTRFPDGPARSRALGVYGAVLSAGFAAGVVAGGLITTFLTWRWVMIVNVPVGFAAIVAAYALLPADRSHRKHGRSLDLAGAACGTATVLALLYTVSQAGHAGWGSLQTLVLVVVAALGAGVFLVVERVTQDPLVPIWLLRHRNLVVMNLAAILTCAAGAGVTLILTLHMQSVLGYEPLRTGLTFSAFGGAAIVAGVVLPRLATRAGSTHMLIGGLATQALSIALLALAADREDTANLIGALMGFGFGHVAAVVSYTTRATSGMRPDDQGVVGGMLNTAQQLGAGVGVALLAAIATARGVGGGNLEVLGAAYRDALFAGALLSAGGALLVAGFDVRRRRASEP